MNFTVIDESIIMSYEQLKIELNLKQKLLLKLRKRLSQKYRQTYIPEFFDKSSKT